MAIHDEKGQGVLNLEQTDSSSNNGDVRFDEDNTADRRGDWTAEEERKLV